MPDFAALVRSLCVALEAWPQGVPKPELYAQPNTHTMNSPLGLQHMVRPLLSLLQ